MAKDQIGDFYILHRPILWPILYPLGYRYQHARGKGVFAVLCNTEIVEEGITTNNEETSPARF